MGVKVEMEYYSATEIARKWVVSQRTVTRYCRAGLVPGAKQDEKKKWQIPADSPKPALTEYSAAKLLYYFETEGRKEELREALAEEGKDFRKIEDYFVQLEFLESRKGKTVTTRKTKMMIQRVKGKEVGKQLLWTVATALNVAVQVLTILEKVSGLLG